MSIQLLSFVFIMIISFIIIGFFLRLSDEMTYKITVLGLSIGVFIYSGIGISYKEISDFYIFPYAVYLMSILTGFCIIARKINIKEKKRIIISFGGEILNRKILLILSIVYLLSRITYLVIPTFRLQNLLIPPAINVYEVQALRRLFEGNSILSLCEMIGILTLPFFLIYINGMVNQGKKIKVLLLLFFWFYLNFAIYEYISRSEIITAILFIYLISQYENGKLKLRKRNVVLTLFGIFFSVPILYIYENYRLNHTFVLNNILESYINIFNSETSYPKYFDILYNNNSIYGIGEYFMWLFTLPIPKGIIPIEIVTFNAYFTNIINQYLDYIVLPSALGESFMIFGKYLYWLHGMIIGLIVGFTYKALIRYTFAPVIILYIGVLCFSIGRGGSMQIISFCINCLLSIWIGIVMSKLTVKVDR